MNAILIIAETNQTETLDFAALAHFEQSPEDRATYVQLRKAKAARRLAAWAELNTPLFDRAGTPLDEVENSAMQAAYALYN